MFEHERDKIYAVAKRNQCILGASLCLLLIVWIAASFAIKIFFDMYSLEKVLGSSLYTFLISDISQYAIALPLALIVMHFVPTLRVKQMPMKFKHFIGFFCVSIPIMFLGNIIGVVMSSAISGGGAEDRVSDLISSSDTLETFVFVVILAPLVEEFLFRKQLIDKLRVYGEKRAIVFSALAFALFHTNLFQFFYAFGLGLVFGYMYMRTSRLRYTIFLHMIINFQGSIVAMWLEKQLVDASGNMIDVEKMSRQELASLPTGFILAGIYGMFMIAMLIVGVVLLIRCRKYLVFFESPKELSKKDGTRTLYGNIGVIAFLAITVFMSVVSVLL